MTSDPRRGFWRPSPRRCFFLPVLESHRTFTEQYSGRQLELIGVPSLAELPDVLIPRNAPFVLFVATGSSAMAEPELVELCERVIGLGAVYASCWGPECKRLEVCFDQAESALHPGARSIVLTTCHEHDSLEDAIWFVVHAAYPDDDYEDGWNSVVIATVGNDDWRRRAEAFLAAGAPGPADA